MIFQNCHHFWNNITLCMLIRKCWACQISYFIKSNRYQIKNYFHLILIQFQHQIYILFLIYRCFVIFQNQYYFSYVITQSMLIRKCWTCQVSYFIKSNWYHSKRYFYSILIQFQYQIFISFQKHQYL